MPTEQWIYELKHVVSLQDNLYVYRLRGPAGAVGIVPVPHNEDGDVKGVFFRVQGPPQGVLMEVIHAVHFLSPIPSLLLELRAVNGAAVTRTIQISNPDGNGFFEDFVSDVEYVEKKNYAPKRETKTAALRFLFS